MNYQKIKLIQQTFAKNAYAQQVPTETVREVYAKVDSVGGREFFAAQQIGIKPELKLSFVTDYNGERLAEVDGERYVIYRTYQTLEDYCELYLHKEIGENED